MSDEDTLHAYRNPAIMFEVGVFQGATAPVIVHALRARVKLQTTPSRVCYLVLSAVSAPWRKPFAIHDRGKVMLDQALSLAAS